MTETVGHEVDVTDTEHERLRPDFGNATHLVLLNDGLPELVRPGHAVAWFASTCRPVV